MKNNIPRFIKFAISKIFLILEQRGIIPRFSRIKHCRTFETGYKNIIQKHPSAGFSITEVTVAAVVFAITAVGIISTVSAVRTPSATSQKDVQAAYYGQNILDGLRAKVDERNWLDPSGSLSVGTHTLPPNGIYKAVYNVSDDGTGRKVDLNIRW